MKIEACFECYYLFSVLAKFSFLQQSYSCNNKLDLFKIILI